jgi:RNA polymerase sigma factor (sigma-70 family)
MKATEFATVYQRHASDVRRFALYLSGNHGDADEIACETFVRAWIATGDIRVETVKAYLFSIARNLYIGRLRRQSRHTELTPAMSDALEDPAPDPEQNARSRAGAARTLDASRRARAGIPGRRNAGAPSHARPGAGPVVAARPSAWWRW